METLLESVLAQKPNPALLAVSNLDEEAVRSETIRTLKACRRNNTPVELTLKDISSVGNNPDNLDRWAKTVMETVLGFE